MNNKRRQLYFIFLNAYKSVQIMESTPLKMIINVASEKKSDDKRGKTYTNKGLALI